MGRRRERYVFMTEEKPHRVRGCLTTLLITAVVLTLLVLLLNLAWTGRVTLKSVRVTVQNLPEEIENWSILHISDLHGKTFGEEQRGIAEALGGKRSSCVVLSGDMSGKDGDVSAALALMKQLPADVPVLLAPGDEDPPLVAGQAHGSLSIWSDWAQALIDAGAIPLDEPACLTRGKSRLWFIPEYLLSLDLDSLETAYRTQLAALGGADAILTPDQSAQRRAAEYQMEKITRIRAAKAEITEKDVVIVVSHTPLSQEYIYTMINWQGKGDVFSLRNTDLILSGHYCGGGWRLPFGRAIWVPELGFLPEDNRVQGLSTRYGVPQYISPGLAGSVIYGLMKGRLFNPPVITMIYLTRKLV